MTDLNTSHQYIAVVLDDQLLWCGEGRNVQDVFEQVTSDFIDSAIEETGTNSPNLISEIGKRFIGLDRAKVFGLKASESEYDIHTESASQNDWNIEVYRPYLVPLNAI